MKQLRKEIVTMRYLACSLFGSCFCVWVAWADPVMFSGTGNFYDLVLGEFTWNEAKDAAEVMTFQGISGHLVTITSSAENDFLETTFYTGQPDKFAWIGGFEPKDDGVWLWGAGPETGIQFSFYEDPTPPFNFASWEGVEPNDNVHGEDFAALNIGLPFANVDPGGWIDSPYPNPADPIIGFLVEFEAQSIFADGFETGDLSSWAATFP